MLEMLKKELGIKEGIMITCVDKEKVRAVIDYMFEEFANDVWEQHQIDLAKTGDDKKLFQKGYNTHMIYFKNSSFTFISVADKYEVDETELIKMALKAYNCFPVVVDFKEWCEIVAEIKEERKGMM